MSISLGALFYKQYKNAKAELGKTPAKVTRTSSLDLPPGSKVVGKKKWQKKKKAPAVQKVKTTTTRTQTSTTPTEEPEPDSGKEKPVKEKNTSIPQLVESTAGRPAWESATAILTDLQSVTIVPSADTSVFAKPESMQKSNTGADTSLFLRGNNCFTLTDYDISPIQGWTIRSATWHGKVRSGRIRTLTFSSILTPWEEGRGILYSNDINGASYQWADYNTVPWTKENDPALTVMRGNSRSICSYPSFVEIERQEDEWITQDIDPLLIQSLIAGNSHGIAIFDASGQATSSNILLYSRETEDGHFLEIKGELVDIEAPGPVQDFRALIPDDLRREKTAGIKLEWLAPGDDGNDGQAFRYDVRYSSVTESFERANKVRLSDIPWPPMPTGRKDSMIIHNLNPGTTYNIFIAAVDESGQRGPVAQTRITTPPPFRLTKISHPQNYPQEPLPLFNRSIALKVYDEFTTVNPISGHIYSGQDGTISQEETSSFWHRDSRTLNLKAARNETVAFKMSLRSGRKEFPRVAFEMSEMASPSDDKISGTAMHFYRVGYQPGADSQYPRKRRLYADALIPLDGYLEVPWKLQSLSRQTVQTVYAELNVPIDAEPGLYRAELKMRTPNGRKETLSILLNVLPLTLPDETAFTVELLCPPTVAGFYRKNIFNSSEAVPIEQSYHQLAREHRCSMVMMPYSSDGQCPQPFSPPIEGQGLNTTVTSWGAWDERFGAYLNGDAYEGLFGGAYPQSHIILPVFESWPVPYEEGYRCAMWDIPTRLNGIVFAGPAEEINHCMEEDYWRAMHTASRQFARHFRTKGWHTTAHIWINNSPTNQYKGIPPRWNIGHPQYRDDFIALTAYGEILAESDWPDKGMLYRVNIPDAFLLQQYGTGIFDLLSVSDETESGWRLLHDRQQRHEEILWLQSDDIPLEKNTYGIAIKALNYFLRGADGWSIRNAVGHNGAWRMAQNSALLYSGAPLKMMHPMPSLRLKTLHRTVQDIELLLLLQSKMNWTREQLKDFVRQYIPNASGTNPTLNSDWHYLRHAVQQALIQ